MHRTALFMTEQRAAERIGDHLPGLRAPVRFVRHHRAHAASAVYPSGFGDPTALVLDGLGKLECGSAWAPGPAARSNGSTGRICPTPSATSRPRSPNTWASMAGRARARPWPWRRTGAQTQRRAVSWTRWSTWTGTASTSGPRAPVPGGPTLPRHRAGRRDAERAVPGAAAPAGCQHHRTPQEHRLGGTALPGAGGHRTGPRLTRARASGAVLPGGVALDWELNLILREMPEVDRLYVPARVRMPVSPSVRRWRSRGTWATMRATPYRTWRSGRRRTPTPRNT